MDKSTQLGWIEKQRRSIPPTLPYVFIINNQQSNNLTKPRKLQSRAVSNITEKEMISRAAEEAEEADSEQIQSYLSIIIKGGRLRERAADEWEVENWSLKAEGLLG